MTGTYCGKSCDTCLEKSQLNCPGCRMGPGRVYLGDCTIAKCCVSRNHQSCADCTTASTCFNRRSSSTASSSRLKKQKDEVFRQQRLYGLSELLGNWLQVLFWLVIASNIADFFLNDAMLLEVPAMKFPAAIINAAFSLSYALILLKLSSVSEHYRTAGISMLVCTGLNFLISVMDSSGGAIALGLISTIPAFIAVFQEFMGHADAAEELDPYMAEKWRTLWYWNFGCLCATVLGTLLTLIGLLIAALIVLVAAIGTIVVAIFKIIYLYRTAKAFREYVEVNQEIA